ncbi:MAG: hypothetical protein ABI666_13100 [Ferruginibacter sp.]
MKTIFLFILVFFGLSVNAQKERAFKEKYVKIDMPELPIAEFPENSIHVSRITVIQSVSDSVRMGYAHKGLDFSIATLIFKKPLTEILQKQVSRMYKHEFKKDGVTIFWVIKDLRFGAKLGASDYTAVRIVPDIGNIDCSYTRFNADAYISSDGNSFKKVCSLDTVLVVLNLARGHGPDLENALRVLLRRTLLTGKEVLEQTVDGLTVEQITDQAVQKPIVPIMVDSNYREGAYASYAEFLANNPSIRNYEKVVGKKKKITLISIAANGQKDTLNVWGICKNGEIYKYHGQSLIPIEKKDAGFIVSGYVEKTARRNNNNFNIGLAADVAVGVTATIMAGGVFMNPGIFFTIISISGKPLLVDSIPYIDDPKMQPLATCIDMRTGEFSF